MVNREWVVAHGSWARNTEIERRQEMTTASNITPSSKPNMLAGILTRAAEIVLVLLVQGAIVFAASGNLRWIWAWVFLGIYLVSIAVNASFLMRRSPETVAERGTAPLTQTWDKIVSSVWAVAQYLLVPLVAALDVRLLWSGEVGLGWHIAGAILFTGGLGLFGWAMITNAYFSTAVRIQSERGHAVCTSGPYRAVRHPGYAGVLLQNIGVPLLLGSWWALIPSIVGTVAMTARTVFEDRTLRAELTGYNDYAQRVRYELIPGIW
jgi:protein-S-isoprenylcysteine O-methyltransferase Ste14